jgi:hypothetical protein
MPATARRIYRARQTPSGQDQTAMNLGKNPTVAELQELLRTADETAGHHMLWVDSTGGVHLDLIPEDLTPAAFEQRIADRLRFRYETYQRWNDLVGSSAAADYEYSRDLFETLCRDWREGHKGSLRN